MFFNRAKEMVFVKTAILEKVFFTTFQGLRRTLNLSVLALLYFFFHFTCRSLLTPKAFLEEKCLIL